eukprot:12196897-Karenia_brevis.AAC.1
MSRQRPEGPRILKVVAHNCIFASMSIQGWPAPDNNPTMGAQLDYQAVPEVDTTIADQVWQQGHVTADKVPPPAPQVQ